MSNQAMTVVIICIVVVITIIPFVAYSVMNKNKKRKKAEALKVLAHEMGVDLNEYDMTPNFFIGVDQNNLKLFYVAGNSDKPNIIDLNIVKRFEVLNASRKIGPKSENSFVVDRLDLGIVFKDSSKKDMRLEFYNVEMNTILKDELQILEKWVGKLNSLLRPTD